MKILRLNFLFFFAASSLWQLQSHASDVRTDSITEIFHKLDSLLKSDDANPYDSALLLNSHAYELAINAGNDSLMLQANYNFAKIYFESSNFMLALKYFFKVLEQFEAQPLQTLPKRDIYRYRYSCTNIAYCYLELGMNELAESYYLKTKELIEAVNDIRQDVFKEEDMIVAFFNIATVYMNMNEWDRAKAWLDQIENAVNLVDNPELRIANLNNQGLYHEERKEYGLALDKYYQALEKAESISDIGIRARVLFNIGDVLMLLDRKEEALEYFVKSQRIGKEASNWITVLMAYASLAEIYAGNGDYRRAYNYSKDFNRINDSTYGSQASFDYAQLAFQYDLEKTMAIKHLEQEALLKEKKNAKTLNFLLLLLILLLLVVAVLFINMLVRKSRIVGLKHELQLLKTEQLNIEKERIEKELATKQRHLTEKALLLLQKNELITLVGEKLEKASEKYNEIIAEDIAAIADEMLKDSSKPFWKEFEMRFSEVHDGFFTALHEKFPKLTPAEKKLAAFLRLNLSTKDIATITYQNPDSIKVARSRLRKKLGLNTQDNLISFLEGI